ncbi:glycine cleavage system protein R [Roseibacillus persicicus]|uniref:glycine cleavage system protein R n=1 Tax=Roseibacillus persicicus TaxID=454148 RepID=UPI00280F52B2|nr:ACT domain-containing protein [Roseibacillus persicicus]MDQ8189930.1 ACT domain-containing protein [Roseibacillus persicicus]
MKEKVSSSMDERKKAVHVYCMQETLVLTVLGPDRTGIVDSLASAVNEHGGSWQESQMARLAGQFAGLVRVTCPADAAAGLTTALENLSSANLRISVVQETSADDSEVRSSYHLDVLGNDRPGILSEVSRVLRSQNANIVEMETRLEPAPESGQAIFHTIASVTLIQDASPEDLAHALEELSPDLQVSLS